MSNEAKSAQASPPVPEYANPMPAGLAALAMACFGFYALFTGKVSPSSAPILACWLVGGFVIQLVVALIEYKEKSLGGSNLFLVFANVFMLIGALSAATKTILRYHGIPFDPTIEGWMWIPVGVWVIMVTLSFLRAPKLLFIMGVFLCISVPFLILFEIGVQGDRALWASIAGHCVLIAAIIATYLGGAMVINGVYGKQILPMSTPFLK